MAHSSRSALDIRRVNSETPLVLAHLKKMTAHLTFLNRIGESKAVEARELLRIAAESRSEALQLHHQLEQLAEFRSSVKRRDLGDQFGAFASNYNGLIKQIGHEFDKMDAAARSLYATASSRINEPGRWDADDRVTELLPALANLLSLMFDVWGQLRTRKKLET
jgi:hypothetical protein